MTESQYLYGVQVEEFLYLPYKQAIRFKLEACRTLHKELYGKDSTHDEKVRLFRIQKAIKHNERLIKEWE